MVSRVSGRLVADELELGVVVAALVLFVVELELAAAELVPDVCAVPEFCPAVEEFPEGLVLAFADCVKSGGG
jgi:hypothetical protein